MQGLLNLVVYLCQKPVQDEIKKDVRNVLEAWGCLSSESNGFLVENYAVDSEREPSTLRDSSDFTIETQYTVRKSTLELS